MITTFTNTGRAAAQELADHINQAWLDGREIAVNGREVRTWHTPRTTKATGPAHVWGTGSVSVDVPTRKGNGITQMWVRAGQEALVEVKPSTTGRCSLHPAFEADYCPSCGTSQVIGGGQQA